MKSYVIKCQIYEQRLIAERVEMFLYSRMPEGTMLKITKKRLKISSYEHWLQGVS